MPAHDDFVVKRIGMGLEPQSKSYLGTAAMPSPGILKTPPKR